MYLENLQVSRVSDICAVELANLHYIAQTTLKGSNFMERFSCEVMLKYWYDPFMSCCVKIRISEPG